MTTLAIFFLFASCAEKKAKAVPKKNNNFASQILYNADMTEHDSGSISMRLKAPMIEKYEFIDTPYVVAPKGIFIELFDKKDPKTPGRLWAKYAKMIDMKQFYFAKGDVKIINKEGQTFKMQSLFWNKAQHRLYTHDTVFISDKSGNILIGAHGMTAKDDMSSYSLYSSFGQANPQKLPDFQK